MKKRIILVLAAAGLIFSAGFAQEVGEYGFLELPVSAHTAALGGTVVSVVEPEGALADQNPALLCPEMEGQLNLSYMNYVADINLGYASFTGMFRSEGAWQAGVKYVNYGQFDGYDEYGSATGTFGAQDVALHGGIGYPINEKWRVGASARAIYSKYEQESAFALGVDVGLNYYNEASGRSFSMVLTNLGGQLKSLDDRRCNLPTQLAIGVTKEVEHLPFCFSLTGVNLFDWKQDYISANGVRHRYSNAQRVLNHLVFGAEWIASEDFYIAAGYSFRRQWEYSGDGGFLRGLSAGAGLNWKYWQFQVSYASYNAVDGSLLIGVGYAF